MNWLISNAFRIASVTFCSSALLFTATGCEDANDLGVEVPGTSPISTEYRDYSVTASTILQDSAETLNAERALAGRINDDAIGTTTAKAFFNLRAGSEELPSLFTNTKLDSVVLVMSFDQVYGSAARPISFDLYNLASSLEEKKSYNAGVSVPLGTRVATNLISSLNRTKTEQRKNGLKKLAVDANGKFLLDATGKKYPGTVDSTTSITVPDQTIRLVLHKDQVRNSEFATQLFTAMKDASFSQTRLNELWKGLGLVPSDGYAGAVAGLNRLFDNRVYFYFTGTKTGATAVTSQSYSVRLANSYGINDPNAPRYYTQLTTDFKAPFNVLTDPTKSATTADGLAYMQEGIGLGTKLVISDIDALKGQNALAINRAELLIPVKSSGALLFPSPTQAYLYELNANNRVLLRTINTSPAERIVQTNLASPLGQGNEAIVSLYNVSPTNKYYSVVITTYLQAYLANQLGEQPAAFMLSPFLRRSFGLSLNRSVLDARNIKLRVYSSKLR
ncbi:DUF4270 domain-containing protein [Hymenobacter sp. BT635]|uniref:DUF4270 domain-containing protein n=1 Tax=Hymenobacter nitidus TaxID=2880929 RepID=A0ABS8AMF4_9BACT|nr:DUF4270 family protein [Hymenobacter nitidus]MCB2380169.1 DUF4270 domain-containing protein [Hymenobacter nitidus]